MEGVRVLVVGRARMHREALAAFLRHGRGLHVVAAVDAAAAPQEAHATDADVVVVDAADDDVAAAVGPLAAAGRRVVAVGTEETLDVCAAAGISGFLLVESAPEELSAAVELAARGGTTFGPAVVGLLLRSGRDREGVADALTTRELEVVRLVADGLSNKQIAVRLGIERHTVKNHLNNSYRKLGVTNRTEAVARLRGSVA